MQCRYDAVLFDLDGTVSQSDPGILNGVRYTLSRLGLPEPQDMRRLIGPPLYYGFTEICGVEPERAQEAISLYRDYYSEKGAYENVLYPGMQELLDHLRSAGTKVCLATAKAKQPVELVLAHFGLQDCFCCVSAAQDAERGTDKEGLIRSALAQCGVDPTRAVMLGDTKYDAEGAAAAGVDFIGVLYGYGTREEMQEYGASRFAACVPELQQMLFED